MSKRHHIKGPTPEERQRMVKDSLRILANGMVMRETTDIEKLILSLKLTIKRVNGHLESIDQAVLAAGGSHDRSKLKEEAQRMYLEGCYPYNKEELLFLLVCLLTDQSVAQIV